MNHVSSFAKVSLTIVGVAVVSALLAASNSSDWQPMPQARLSNYVGAVEGECCTPGNRLGCALENFDDPDCSANPDASGCTATGIAMDCTDAECTARDPEDVCDYSPQTVGINTCKCTGTTVTTGCGVVYYTTGWYDSTGAYHPAGNYQEYRCDYTIDVAWNAAGHQTSTADVCDGASTCTVSYALCEG